MPQLARVYIGSISDTVSGLSTGDVIFVQAVDGSRFIMQQQYVDTPTYTNRGQLSTGTGTFYAAYNDEVPREGPFIAFVPHTDPDVDGLVADPSASPVTATYTALSPSSDPEYYTVHLIRDNLLMVADNYAGSSAAETTLRFVRFDGTDFFEDATALLPDYPAYQYDGVEVEAYDPATSELLIKAYRQTTSVGAYYFTVNVDTGALTSAGLSILGSWGYAGDVFAAPGLGFTSSDTLFYNARASYDAGTPDPSGVDAVTGIIGTAVGIVFSYSSAYIYACDFGAFAAAQESDQFYTPVSDSQTFVNSDWLALANAAFLDLHSVLPNSITLFTGTTILAADSAPYSPPVFWTDFRTSYEVV